MPITPFHGGIGLAFKGPLGRRFSFTIFVATQIAIDLESGYFLFTKQWPVHRFLHTFVGASMVCLAVAVLARPLCERFLRFCNAKLGEGRPGWLDLATPISFPTSLFSAAIGMIGHVVPDSIMHADAHPLAPFSDHNPLLNSVSLLDLHLALIVAGAAGLAWMVLTAAPRRAFDTKTPVSAITASSMGKMIEALEREAATKIAALQARMSACANADERTALRVEIDEIRSELKRRKRSASESLF